MLNIEFLASLLKAAVDCDAFGEVERIYDMWVDAIWSGGIGGGDVCDHILSLLVFENSTDEGLCASPQHIWQ